MHSNFRSTPHPASRRRWLARAAALLVLVVPLAAAAQPRIVNPSPDETVHSNTGEVAVVVTGVPPGTRLAPVLDGTRLDRTAEAPAFRLEGVDRGTHRLRVLLLDAGGQVGGRTDEVEFHVWQASRLFPSRQGAQP